MLEVTSAELGAFLELMRLAPDASTEDVKRLCEDAQSEAALGVCLHGGRILEAYAMLEETPIKVTCLVAYPLGAMDSDVKRYETETAVDHGAREIEVVANLGRLKDQDYPYFLRELRDVVEAADERPVKVVLEGGLLTHDEKVTGCELILDSGARGISCATNLDRTKSQIEDVKLYRQLVGAKFDIKALFKRGDVVAARELIAAGVTRVGAC
jgi:deoxyribose-phosphate aldolase